MSILVEQITVQVGQHGFDFGDGKQGGLFADFGKFSRFCKIPNVDTGNVRFDDDVCRLDANRVHVNALDEKTLQHRLYRGR